MLKEYIESKNKSVYAVAKGCNLPYTTLNEIVIGKKSIEDCNYKTISKIATYFNMSVDEAIRQFGDENSPKIISTSWEDAKSKEYIFPNVCDTTNAELLRIHPLKQKTILQILSFAKTDSRILSLIIFGSSINIRCNKNSDIDIAIKLKDAHNNIKNDVSEKIQEICNYEADIIWMDKIQPNSKIYNNITKGVHLI